MHLEVGVIHYKSCEKWTCTVIPYVQLLIISRYDKKLNMNEVYVDGDDMIKDHQTKISIRPLTKAE